MSKGTSVAGTCFSVSPTMAETLTDYKALSDWAVADEAKSYGDFGAQTQVIKFDTVCDGVTNKRMGAADYGTQTIELLFDSDNPAQEIIAVAAENRAPLSCRFALPLVPGNSTRDMFYYRAYVQQVKVSTGSANDTVDYIVTLEIDSAVLLDKATA